MRCITIVVALGIGACGAAADDSPTGPPPVDPSLEIYAQPQRLVELPGGRHIHFFCAGEGSPTVILTIGLGGWVANWNGIQQFIAHKTRACAWDRAGFGYSDPDRAPQDVKRAAADLEEALRIARIKGPYVLVASSAGSYESMLFADKHLREVSGMVLIDPSFPDEMDRTTLVAPHYGALLLRFVTDGAANARKCAATVGRETPESGSAGADQCFKYPPQYPAVLKEALRRLDRDSLRWTTRASTFEHVVTSMKVVINGHRNYDAIVIRILTAPEPFPPDLPADAAAEWPRVAAEVTHEHDAMARLSTDGVNTVVVGTNHASIKESSDVLAALDEVIEKTRHRRR